MTFIRGLFNSHGHKENDIPLACYHYSGNPLWWPPLGVALLQGLICTKEGYGSPL